MNSYPPKGAIIIIRGDIQTIVSKIMTLTILDLKLLLIVMTYHS